MSQTWLWDICGRPGFVRVKFYLVRGAFRPAVSFLILSKVALLKIIWLYGIYNRFSTNTFYYYFLAESSENRAERAQRRRLGWWLSDAPRDSSASKRPDDLKAKRKREKSSVIEDFKVDMAGFKFIKWPWFDSRFFSKSRLPNSPFQTCFD